MSDLSKASFDARHLPLLSLPLEIRIQIYRECVNSAPPPVTKKIPMEPTCLSSKEKYEQAVRKYFNMHEFYPLLATCKTIQAEATTIFDNHFQPIPGFAMLDKFLHSLDCTRRSNLRKLSFVHHFSYDREYFPELMTKCFRLMAYDCPNLKTLLIYVSELDGKTRSASRLYLKYAYQFAEIRSTAQDAFDAAEVRSKLAREGRCPFQQMEKIEFRSFMGPYYYSESANSLFGERWLLKGSDGAEERDTDGSRARLKSRIWARLRGYPDD